MFGLTKEDLSRLDENGIRYLIQNNEQRIKQWSIPNYEKDKLTKENAELKKLLKLK